MKTSGQIVLPYLISRTTACEVLRDLFEYDIPALEIDDDDVQGFSDEGTYFQVEDTKTSSFCQISHEVIAPFKDHGIQTRLKIFGPPVALQNVTGKIQAKLGGDALILAPGLTGRTIKPENPPQAYPDQKKEADLFSVEAQRKLIHLVNLTLSSISNDAETVRSISSSLGDTFYHLVKETCERDLEKVEPPQPSVKPSSNREMP